MRMIKCFASLALLAALLHGGSAFAQSTSNCVTKQSEEEYQKCIERNSTNRKFDPRDIGLGNSSVNTTQPLEDDITGGLPDASIRHIRREMAKKVYAEVGEWSPEARKQEFDFDPSEGAAGDAELRAEEEAAFAAAVSDYHDLEQAAYEAREADIEERNTSVSGAVNAPDASSAGADVVSSGEARSAIDILGDLNVLGGGQGGGEGTAPQPGENITIAGDVAIGGPQGTGPDPTQAGGAAQAEAQDEAAGAATGQTASAPPQDGARETETGDDASTASNGETPQTAETSETADTAQASQDTQRSVRDVVGGLEETADATEQQDVPGAQRSAQDILDDLEETADAAPQQDASSAQTPSGTQRSAQDIVGDLDGVADEAAPQDTATAQTPPGTQRSAEDIVGDLHETPDTASQQNTSTAQAPAGSPSNGDGPPPAPTRPIPPADPTSAAILASLFSKAEDKPDLNVTASPLQDWSDPDAGAQDSAAILQAAQTVLEPSTVEAAPDLTVPTDPAAQARAAEKEQARAAFFADEAATAPTASQAASLTTSDEASVPPQTAARLATMSLP